MQSYDNLNDLEVVYSYESYLNISNINKPFPRLVALNGPIFAAEDQVGELTASGLHPLVT